MTLRSQRTQAFHQAGAAVAEMTPWDGETLEELAEKLIRSADPHVITGQRGERFEWSFSYSDAPEIAAEAQKIIDHA